MPWPKLGDGSDAAQTRLGYQDAGPQLEPSLGEGVWMVGLGGLFRLGPGPVPVRRTPPVGEVG